MGEMGNGAAGGICERSDRTAQGGTPEEFGLSTVENGTRRTGSRKQRNQVAMFGSHCVRVATKKGRCEVRNVRFLVAFGLVLAVSGMAGAVGIPMRGTGPIVSHLTNYDDGVVYDYNNGFLADNITPIAAGQQYDPSLVKKAFSGYKLDPGESTWGIFKIDQALLGAITGPNTITPTGSNVLYTDGDAGIEVVGIFYGRFDVSVSFSVDPYTQAMTQVIRSSGDNFEVFTQPTGTYDDGNAGAMARVVSNEYAGVGYDGAGTNTLLPGAQLVLTGTTQSGLVSYDSMSTFTPSGPNTGSGTFSQFWSVGAVAGTAALGSDNAWWDTNVFPNGGAMAFVDGTTADFRLQGTTSPTNKQWLVSSSDPLTGAFVPEPLTMLGVFMAVGSLGGYIRKRRSAAS